MTDNQDSPLFAELSRELLGRGLSVRFQARGASMSPAIRDGETVVITPVIMRELQKGDIVLTESNAGFRLHRIVIADPAQDRFVTRGDCGQEDDGPVSRKQILGIARSKEIKIGRKMVRADFNTTSGRLLCGTARLQRIASRWLGLSAARRAARASLLIVVLALIAAAASQAQVAIDASTNGTGTITGPTPASFTFTHTTSTGTNRLLIVGVSINITQSTGTGVSGITYGGTPLNFVGAHNDAGTTRRVEMWYLLNPASGTKTIAVTVDVPTAASVGVVAGATTFTGVDQTVPLGTFVAADGAGATYSQIDVPSVVNGMVIDTLAIDGSHTAAATTPQNVQWNTNTGTNANQDVTGLASSRAGAPSMPMSETFSAATNWSLGAISVNPSTADVGVSTSVATVVSGQNSTYNITVKNNGPSAANNVTLTDTLASGVTFISATPSAGTTCTGTGPISCTLPTPLASGATATIAVVVKATTSGAYSNTATVTDSGTPPDPNTGNNTYVSVATVQTISCANTSQGTPGGALTGTVNTYYPGTASAAAGATSISIGAATGAGQAIATGNLLLVIQMQDASINVANNVTYGNGSTGAGFSALNSAGNYEFVTANNNVGTGGGTLNIVGSGNGGGLVFGYHATAAGTSNGVSTFQVIVVPQYTTATLSSGLTALPWNGSTGGVLALDASGTVSLNGATVSVDGAGFRGGAGMQLQGGGGANTDFLATAPATYTGAARSGWDAPKGEGVAGTPLWVESGGTYLNTGTDYPSGTAADGSMARGAPGNAGGGGTDGDPQTASPGGNDQNAGGGGGGNGGSGGFGGDSWNSNLSTGGEGGAAFPATVNRIAMGGGGGAGTRNNSDGDALASSAAAGGGIIILRANALSGTGTLTANGAAAYNLTANDAGGGGGAGGSIVVLSENGGESGLTLHANGGNGGNAWQGNPFTLGNRHGPGGGGGGGVIFVSANPGSASVNGGTNGLTENPGVPYGATSGGLGTVVTNASLASTSGTQSGAQCAPDMTLGKSHIGNFTRGGTASYTIPVENVSIYGTSSGVVTMDDTLPLGLTPTSATGTGWSCGVASQTVSCTRGDSLAPGTFYPSITVNASVSQSAPAVVTNTAYIAGGGDGNPANNSATDVANVVSTADLSMSNAASPNPVAAGSNITYTQIITNNGTSAADNATVVAAVPVNTTFVSEATPAGWTCLTPGVGSVGTVVCSTSNLPAGTGNTATFTMVVKVNNGVSNGTVITGTATASSSTSDPNSANNTAVATTLVGTTTQAEMVVTNSALPNPVVAGSNITYTQTSTNVGSVTANSPTLTETIPANTTFQSISYPAGVTCTTPAVGGTGTINCSSAAAPAGTSGTISVVVQVNAGTASGTVITDTVTVNSTNQAFGANSATATDVVASATQADLALSTVATPSPGVLAGNNITYTQTITNNGPAAASTVTFTEATPANTTYQSIAIPSGWNCTTPAVGATGTITCTTTSVAASASANIVVTVNVASSVTALSTTATSTVSASGTTDPNLANNSTSVNTGIAAQCDLVVTNSGTPNTVLVGGTITYTQTVTNSGPSNCANVSFTEAIPANTTLSSFTAASGWTCTTTGSISCTNASFAPNGTSTFTFVTTVNAGTGSGTVIVDTDTATTTTTGNTSDNTATVDTTVAAAGQADLSITDAGSPNPVTAGNNITFTQVATNNGPANSRNVTLTETLPANTTFVSLTGPAGWTCRNTTPYTCTIGTFNANSTATFTFVVTVNATVASGTTITDTSSIASRSTTDPNTTNNTATASVVVGDSADLSVTITGTPVPVQAGNNITYTQTVTNAGPSVATSATFVESTPPNTTFVSLTPTPTGWTCALPAVGSAGTISCTNPNFAAGSSSFPLVLKVTVGTAAGTTITLTGTASSSVTDPNTSNNSASFTDVVATNTEADLVVTNVASPTSVAAGSNITYTQTVKNNGPAAATTATFTEVTPPNTTFVSLTPVPTGWSCTTPTAGTTGTISCTDPSLAANATSNFTVVLQVNSATTSGTYISDTATASASNIVPNLTTNSATATVIVANANSADMAIVKTASPNPVSQGDTITYTLAVTNNGPASATNVTVTDSLPSSVTYLSAQTSAGSCSEAGGTVTCLLGTMTNTGTATVTILTSAGQMGTVSNTATVTADQTDPTLTNNSSTQTETIAAATAVRLQYFIAQSGTDGNGAARVVLSWKTGEESENLGFNVYRDVAGNLVKVNSSLIAGSALQMRAALPKHSGKTYTWIDRMTAVAGSQYWLEDVSLTGIRQMHGPVSVEAVSGGEVASTMSRTIAELNQSQPSAAATLQSHLVETVLPVFVPSSGQLQKQFQLAGLPGVKILVDHEGWYQVTQPQLVQAGLNPNVDPASLHLYAEAIEQPIQIVGAAMGPGGFGPKAVLRFYGTAIDTPFSGTRVYWLTSQDSAGARIPQLPNSVGSNQPPESFPDSVILQQHTTYFGALLTTNDQNFFGAIVSSTPVDQVLSVPHLDANGNAELDISLQGVTAGMQHDVSVTLNGTTLGDVTFTGQNLGTMSFSVPLGLLQEGNNTVTLTAQDGDYDISVVAAIRISYAHTYMADGDALKFSGLPGQEIKVGGFQTQSAAVMDVTDGDHPVMLSPRVQLDNGTYDVYVQVPWTASAVAGSAHTLLAVGSDRVATATAIAHHPSHWHSEHVGAPMVMISHEDFVSALAPLVSVHNAQHLPSKVVLIGDLYDEYNFGEHSPYVIRQFLQGAMQNWRFKPQYLLLNGRASYDPRNYLGFGDLDFVPTRIVPASTLMTASDDWFSDFQNTGLPMIATGRLPVSTLADASLVVSKIAGYETSTSQGTWASQALLVADQDDSGDDFTGISQQVNAELPASLNVTVIARGQAGTSTARQQILADINSGALLVNYMGHGSEEEWSGSDIFDVNSANGLTNGSNLPVFLVMDCLNGYFQDVYAQPLGTALLLAPNGGGVAVFASSGLNNAPPQGDLDRFIVENLFNMTLGDAILKAKQQINDLGTRKTYNLLGDPAMHIQAPAQGPAQ